VEEIRKKVEETINMIRPALQADGGDVEFVDIVDGVVQLRLTGACHGCPSAAVTLHQGIERFLKERVPEVVRVEAVA
jgi:Fe-S cluster biogenesis protein NfuA